MFVHLNTSDLVNGSTAPSNTLTNGESSDDFEVIILKLTNSNSILIHLLFKFFFSKSINYKEFADKFPENDLLWSTNTITEKCPCSSYLIKFWVDLNYMLEEGVSSLYAVNNV